MNRKFFSLVLVSLIGIAAALITSAYYNQLRADYDQLKVDYDDLSKAYSILEAVKGFVIDETIEITANTELTVTRGYAVKGNVTNLGDAPIPTLYVLIFVYNPDGSLWHYNDVMIRDLYPGETNAYEFLYPLPDESYTFKVFAVGNYN